MTKINIKQVDLEDSKVTKQYYSFVEFHDTHIVIKAKYECEVTEEDEYDVKQTKEKFFEVEEMYLKSAIVGISRYYNTSQNRDVVKILVAGGEEPIVVFDDKKMAIVFARILHEYILENKIPEVRCMER